MASIQAVRESVSKGDIVHVVTSSGGRTRTREARVTSVMRAAAKVVYLDTGEHTTIMFKYLEIPEGLHRKHTPIVETKRQPPPPSNVVPLHQPVVQVPVVKEEVPVQAPVPAPAPAATEKPKPVDTQTDLEAWLAMGAEILESIGSERAKVSMELRALDEELKAIEKEIEQRRQKLLELDARASKIKGVVR